MSDYECSSNLQVEWVKTQEWAQQKWHPRPALIHKGSNRSSQFVGQSYDPEKIELVPNGWTHDHCEICYQDLYETENPKFGLAYTNGQDWICSACYSKYVS